MGKPHYEAEQSGDLFPQEESELDKMAKREREMPMDDYMQNLKKSRGDAKKDKGPSEAEQEIIGYR